MKKFYVAVDIGCNECKEETNVLGIFTDKNKAWDVLDEHAIRQKENCGGQHYFDVYELNKWVSIVDNFNNSVSFKSGKVIATICEEELEE